ncbi:MAG: hypothetical protein HY001_03265 [Candidatus Portnoybacteria bacterium]|nr:hypothetical protein [Candidatus Portnoybacteria bacterium]
MSQEEKKCQNCKNQFMIEPADFAFYEKMQVPPPTFCPECRLQRRTMFRNERVLYGRKCDSCGKDIITVFAPDKPYRAYCSPCWWSDKWDGTEFGQEYDPSQNFFKQLLELSKKVPYMNLVIDYPTMVNAVYVNHVGHLKNCYLCFDSDFSEDAYYSTIMYNCKDSMDLLVADRLELCYGDVNCRRSFKTFFSEDSSDCHEVYFSKNCSGCNNCFGCVNLKNKSYWIFNKPYQKEEYAKKLKEFRLDSFKEVERLKEEIHNFWKTQPHKFFHGRRNTNVSGDYIEESKNAYFVYQVYGAENVKFCQRIMLKPAKDSYDYFEWGNNASRIYEGITVGEGADMVKFSFACWKGNTTEVEYSMYLFSTAYMFGCVSLKNKKYCILNRQYSKEEFIKLREKIIQDMNANPYIDGKGRVWKYGEFFPYDLSLFDYNESTAIQYFPLTKEQALEKGFRWYDAKQSEYPVTLKSNNIPDSIHDIHDTILQDVIDCMTCEWPFRIIKQELLFLRKLGFPIPRKCPNCRHQERMNRMNPPRLWHRKTTVVSRKL